MRKYNLLTTVMLLGLLLLGAMEVALATGNSNRVDNTGRSEIYQPEAEKHKSFALTSNDGLPGRFLGGASDEGGWDVAVDSEGNVVVTGQTGSEDFPVSAGVYGGGYRDAFVAKVDPDGALLWSHYLGGVNTDLGLGIAVDSQDNIIVAGRTESSDFPTPDAYDATLDGLADVFVSKYTTGGDLTWSTFLGGSDLDFGHDVFTDSQDNIVVTGETWSSNFPTTGNAQFPTYNGGHDAFVSKFSSDGTQLLLSTYLGGNDTDTAVGIAPYIADHIVVTGYTKSMNFPTVDAYDSTLNGGSDVFVSLFNTTSGSLLWSTYIGGDDWDRGADVIVDSEGYAFVTGDTRSADFPSQNAYDDDYGGSGTFAGDVFVLKIRGSQLEWSTYLGGDGNEDDLGQSVALDAQENIIVTGYTRSADFPTVDACFPDYFGNADAFVSNFSSAGELQWSTFLGGNSSDYAYGVAVDPQNRVVVTGSTYSINFPISLNSHSGQSDAFVVFLVCPDADITTTDGVFPCWFFVIPVVVVTLAIGSALGFVIGKRRS